MSSPGNEASLAPEELLEVCRGYKEAWEELEAREDSQRQVRTGLEKMAKRWDAISPHMKLRMALTLRSSYERFTGETAPILQVNRDFFVAKDFAKLLGYSETHVDRFLREEGDYVTRTKERFKLPGDFRSGTHHSVRYVSTAKAAAPVLFYQELRDAYEENPRLIRVVCATLAVSGYYERVIRANLASVKDFLEVLGPEKLLDLVEFLRRMMKQRPLTDDRRQEMLRAITSILELLRSEKFRGQLEEVIAKIKEDPLLPLRHLLEEADGAAGTAVWTCQIPGCRREIQIANLTRPHNFACEGCGSEYSWSPNRDLPTPSRTKGESQQVNNQVPPRFRTRTKPGPTLPDALRIG